MSRSRVRIPESEDGTILFNTDPIIIKNHYEIDYIHSYAQDSPFFAGLANRQLLGSKCNTCSTIYGTPRGHCMKDGAKTDWVELPQKGRIHSYTVCHFGGQAFLEETPYTLILVEFDGVDTLFMSRLVGAEKDEPHIGMNIQAQFRRNSKFDATDVYFVPVE